MMATNHAQITALPGAGVNIVSLYSNMYLGIVSEFLGKIRKMGRVLSNFDFWIIMYIFEN